MAGNIPNELQIFKTSNIPIQKNDYEDNRKVVAKIWEISS